MPYFRTTPSSSLTNSISRMIASGGGKMSPLLEISADNAAAQTARNLSLAEKARVEAENARLLEQRQNDPNLPTEFAAHSSGIDMPQATRLMQAIRGEVEPQLVANDDEGNPLPPAVIQRPEGLPAGSERLFRTALAAAAANRLATGKTNPDQIARAAENVNEMALVNEAANAPDLATGNRIVSAVGRKMREPYRQSSRGVVLNTETGQTAEGTQLAQAVRDELGARTGRANAQAGFARARTGAVNRGETGRAGQRVTPQQIERWVSETARKEWEALPSRDRKGMNYEQHLTKVRARFAGNTAKDEIEDAMNAITGGADPKLVRQRFKQRMGFALPEVDLLDDDADDATEE